MTRKEALQIGRIIADRWWHHNESTILAKQNIERRKAWDKKTHYASKQLVSNNKFISSKSLYHNAGTFLIRAAIII